MIRVLWGYTDIILCSAGLQPFCHEYKSGAHRERSRIFGNGCETPEVISREVSPSGQVRAL